MAAWQRRSISPIATVSAVRSMQNHYNPDPYREEREMMLLAARKAGVIP